MKKLESSNSGNTYFLFNGKLMNFIAKASEPAVIFQTVKDEDGKHCPHCEKFIEPEEWYEVEGSPNFQNGAEPVQTLKT